MTVLACAVAPATASAAPRAASATARRGGADLQGVPNWGGLRAASRSTPTQAIAIAKTRRSSRRSTGPTTRCNINVYVWGEPLRDLLRFHGKLIADQVVAANGKLGPDLHRAADARASTPAVTTGRSSTTVGARGVHADVPAADPPAADAALAQPSRHRDVLLFGVSYWRFDTAHLESARVAVLPAAPLPDGEDADPGFKAAVVRPPDRRSPAHRAAGDRPARAGGRRGSW